MSLQRRMSMVIVGVLSAAAVSVAPAYAESGWRTALTWQDARAQICAKVHADGTAVVRVRMNNRRGDDKVSAGIASVRADGRPGRTLVTTKFVDGGKVSSAVVHDGLATEDLFFVDIAYRTADGAGIVKTSNKPILVSAQTPCQAG